MTCHPFDACLYHGEICHVEQVWDTDNVHWALIRPISQAALHTQSGVYIVDQDECLPVPTQGAAA